MLIMFIISIMFVMLMYDYPPGALSCDYLLYALLMLRVSYVCV